MLAILMSKNQQKKILEKSPVSGIAVPLAIVLVGALIVWGITQMISTGRDHRDLMNELHSKTFGNRWVAAYELSKYIASSSIPEKDIPWLVNELGSLYQASPKDSKTRNFIVMALGGIKSPLIKKYLLKAVGDPDQEVSFHAIVALGKIEERLSSEELEGVSKKLFSADPGKVQVALMALEVHKYKELGAEAKKLLNHQEPTVRYVATQVLVSLGDMSGEKNLEEILELREGTGFNAVQVEGIKLNLVNALGRSSNPLAIDWLKKLSRDKSLKISTKATQFLNKLKK